MHQARLRQLRHQPLDSPEEEEPNSLENDEEEQLELPENQPNTPKTPISSRFSTISEEIKKRRLTLPFGMIRTTEPTKWKEPQPYEVLRAVENRDLMYLMARRTFFHLMTYSLTRLETRKLEIGRFM